MMNIDYKMITVCAVLGMAYGLQSAEAKQLPTSEKGEQDLLLEFPSNKILKEEEEGKIPSEQELQDEINQQNVFDTFPD